MHRPELISLLMIPSSTTKYLPCRFCCPPTGFGSIAALGMSFNASKCNIITITRKEDPIVTVYIPKDKLLENVKVTSYLGVQISRDVSWHSHVAKVTAKGNKSLGFVRRNKTTSKATKTLVYWTLLILSLEYGRGSSIQPRVPSSSAFLPSTLLFMMP